MRKSTRQAIMLVAIVLALLFAGSQLFSIYAPDVNNMGQCKVRQEGNDFIITATKSIDLGTISDLYWCYATGDGPQGNPSPLLWGPDVHQAADWSIEFQTESGPLSFDKHHSHITWYYNDNRIFVGADVPEQSFSGSVTIHAYFKTEKNSECVGTGSPPWTQFTCTSPSSGGGTIPSTSTTTTAPPGQTTTTTYITPTPGGDYFPLIAIIAVVAIVGYLMIGRKK